MNKDKKQIVIEIAKKTSELLMKYFESGDFYQKSKGGVDFATEADLEADKFILSQLKKNFPDDNFLTEETAPKDYSLLIELDNLWVVDPIDGTVNFSRKTPHFAVSIGQVDKGISKFGVIALPATGDIYFGSVNEDVIKNDKKIAVSKTSELGEVTLACDWAWDLQKRLTVVSWLGKIAQSVRQIKSMGSAVADLAALSEGRIDAYLVSGLKPWDSAAVAIMVEKAGGKITKPDGSKWNIFETDILVTNGILHEKILSLIN